MADERTMVCNDEQCGVAEHFTKHGIRFHRIPAAESMADETHVEIERDEGTGRWCVFIDVLYQGGKFSGGAEDESLRAAIVCAITAVSMCGVEVGKREHDGR